MSIKIKNAEVFGWEAAIRGARNPMNSWDKSDSWFIKEYVDNGRRVDAHQINPSYTNYDYMKNIELRDQIDAELKYANDNSINGVFIGLNDHKLLTNLCKGGTEESKWRRMVHVQMDVTAPLYWWKEFDTYKVGTVSNSCSTMHKIHAKEFTLEDFSCEKLITEDEVNELESNDPNYMEEACLAAHVNEDGTISLRDFVYPEDILRETIQMLNICRELYLRDKNKRYWWQMIQLLPSSYNQKRTIDLNYEVLASQYRQRKDHKLDEWHQYCDWIKTLPYSEFITMEETPKAATRHKKPKDDDISTYQEYSYMRHPDRVEMGTY